MEANVKKSILFMAIIVVLVMILFAIASVFTGCSKDDPSARIIVTLTDSPGDFDAVNVDIEAIEVHRQMGNQESGWISLGNINSGVYDLLELTNGTEVVLTDTEYPAGQISQMRLILGEHNTLETDGQTIDLTVPSGAESGLKLIVNENLIAGLTYTFKLDFDAARSVVKSGGSGSYNLKPVIRVITEATSGGIIGTVNPASENVAVYAMQGMDTLGTSYAIENVTEFLIGGLSEGTYDVIFDPGEMSTLQSITSENVVVVVGIITEMDPVTLE